VIGAQMAPHRAEPHHMKGHPMSNKPNLIAYAVKDRGKNQKAIWTRIGAAWSHEKGGGFTVELEAFPIDGRIILTVPKPEEAPEGGGK
jgi:hypothetical protein